MANKLKTSVYSEIGTLKGVILHTPGKEIENMTPRHAEKALYSDILNKRVVDREYTQFKGVLEKVATTYQVKDLLKNVLNNDSLKQQLVKKIVTNEKVESLQDYLLSLTPEALALQLIEGVETKVDNLTKYLSEERYALQPLHNFFFTRDASASMYDQVLIGRMANKVRDRESFIMQSIFDYSDTIRGTTFIPTNDNLLGEELTIEGGDVLVAREDIIIVGLGARTTSHSIDAMVEMFKKQNKVQHIFVQELPLKPESFIHLDMVFTFLDIDKVMTFDPLIFQINKLNTIHIKIDYGKVHINEETNLLTGLKKLGMDLESISCGGKKDVYIQEREQWHSGANFFAIAPGKIMGYERNVYTIDELNKHGFEVIKAKDIVRGKINLDDYKKCVITIEGSELTRGGGGCRCMTMPVKRQEVSW